MSSTPLITVRRGLEANMVRMSMAVPIDSQLRQTGAVDNSSSRNKTSQWVRPKRAAQAIEMVKRPEFHARASGLWWITTICLKMSRQGTTSVTRAHHAS